MRNVLTITVDNVAGHRNALDIAIENPTRSIRRGRDIETRVDVVSFKIIDATSASITTSGGMTYLLNANLPAAPARATLSDDEIAQQIGTSNLVKLARGQAVTVCNNTFYSLEDYRARCGCGQAAPVRDPNGTPLAVTRISPRLRAALGYTPRVAYKR